MITETQIPSVLAPVDPSRANWLNLLPMAPGRDFLKIGSRHRESLEALALVAGRGLTCLGPPDSLVESVRYCGSLEALRGQIFDVIVADEEDFYSRHGANGHLRDSFTELFDLLRPGGSLVLGLPAGLTNIALRSKVPHVLLDLGIGNVEMFACYPSAADPVRICPLDASGWTSPPNAFHLPWEDHLDANGTARDLARRLAFRVFGGNNPWFGILLIVQKNGGPAKSPNPSLFARVQEIAREQLAPEENRAIGAILDTRPFSWRRYFFLLDKETEDLLFVAKADNDSRAAADPGTLRNPTIEREFATLEAVSRIAAPLERLGILAPRPLHQEAIPGGNLVLTSAVKGQRMDQLVEACWRTDHRAELTRIFCDLSQRSLGLQELLTRHLSNDLPHLDPLFLDTPEGFAPRSPTFGTSGNGSFWIQHGDFSPINLFFDEHDQRFGLIDWEWTAAGYPLLFDLFCLIRTFRPLPESRRDSRHVYAYVLPLTEALFGRDWYSDVVREVLKEQCRYFDIPTEAVFDLFLNALTVLYRRYSLTIDADGFHEEFRACYYEVAGRRSEFHLG